jgi:hypothetical protein
MKLVHCYSSGVWISWGIFRVSVFDCELNLKLKQIILIWSWGFRVFEDAKLIFELWTGVGERFGGDREEF